MIAWEYSTLRFDSLKPVLDGSSPQESDELNRMGKEGWECYWIETAQPFTISLLFFSTSRLHKVRTYFFRREISKNAWV